jgi:hypothetical protein
MGPRNEQDARRHSAEEPGAADRKQSLSVGGDVLERAPVSPVTRSAGGGQQAREVAVAVSPPPAVIEAFAGRVARQVLATATSEATSPHPSEHGTEATGWISIGLDNIFLDSNEETHSQRDTARTSTSPVPEHPRGREWPSGILKKPVWPESHENVTPLSAVAVSLGVDLADGLPHSVSGGGMSATPTQKDSKQLSKIRKRASPHSRPSLTLAPRGPTHGALLSKHERTIAQVVFERQSEAGFPAHERKEPDKCFPLCCITYLGFVASPSPLSPELTSLPRVMHRDRLLCHHNCALSSCGKRAPVSS